MNHLHLDPLDSEALNWLSSTLRNRGKNVVGIPELNDQPDMVRFVHDRMLRWSSFPNNAERTAMRDLTLQATTMHDFSNKSKSGGINGLFREIEGAAAACRELVRFYVKNDPQ